jgi:formylglycine-generating enzyme required for sulfatase activity
MMQKLIVPTLLLFGAILTPTLFASTEGDIADLHQQIGELKTTIDVLQRQLSALEESKQADDLLLKTLKVGGDVDKFYPFVFQAEGWDKGLLDIEIFHVSENGKLFGQFRCHYSEAQLPSSAEIHQPSLRWVADSWCYPDGKNLVVYLRGGETIYSWRSNLPTVLLESMPWHFNQLAWLDSKPKFIMPSMTSATALFNRDDVYALLPVFKILKVDVFSVGGDANQFYPVAFRADGWDEGLLEINIDHTSDKGKLLSQFSCYSEPDGMSPSSAKIHQNSLRWVADSWCNPEGKILVVYLKGGNTTYFLRSNQSVLVNAKLKATMDVMDSMVPLFDKDEVDVSLPSVQKVFQDELKNGGFGPLMVLIPAGRFKMGDIQGGGYDNEQPVREVSINSFGISRYEVTFAEYDQFAEATGRKKPDDEGWGRGNRPVIDVSWDDATAYAEWLSEQTGKHYRLPTETEWEYAARAGRETMYWWGNDIGKNRAACDGCGAKWGWDAERKTAPVASFAHNYFGLYDMVGNVWEWVADPWHDNYEGAPSDGGVWKVGGDSDKVFRGGSWADIPEDCRAAVRDLGASDNRSYALGLRIAVTGAEYRPALPTK